jgi:hypothetical protein
MEVCEMTQTLQNQEDRYTQTSGCGLWKMKENNVIVWEVTTKTKKFDLVLRDWYIIKTEKTELSPENSPFKCKKEMDVDVLLFREKISDDDFSKQVLIYDRKMHIRVKPEFNNVWLHFNASDNRVYVKDLLNQCTYRYDLGKDNYVVSKKISEKRISKEDSCKLKTGYLFAKEELDAENNSLFGQFVKPS